MHLLYLHTNTHLRPQQSWAVGDDSGAVCGFRLKKGDPQVNLLAYRVQFAHTSPDQSHALICLERNNTHTVRLTQQAVFKTVPTGKPINTLTLGGTLEKTDKVYPV